MSAKKLYVIDHLPEDEIEHALEWWRGKAFTTELDRRFQALENGTDKGYTLTELEDSVNKLRKKKYS